MRDILLSGTAGFLFSCTGGFIVHRAIWKAADTHAQQLDAMVSKKDVSGSGSSIMRQQTDSFEGFIGRRIAQWWNHGVDNVYSRLVHFPETVARVVEDAKEVSKGSSPTKA